MIVFNSPDTNNSPFAAAYKGLNERFGEGYEEVNQGRKGSRDEVRAFFAPSYMNTATFENRQTLDLDGLRGRMLSSSYMPVEGEAGFSEMLGEVERIFREHEKDGEVELLYETRMYYGRISRV